MFTVLISSRLHSTNRYRVPFYAKALWEIIGMRWCFLQFDTCYKNFYIICVSIAKLIAKRNECKMCSFWNDNYL